MERGKYIVSLPENDCRLAMPLERFHCFVGQRFAILQLSFSSVMGAPFCWTAAAELARTNDHNYNVRKTLADNASEAEEKSCQLMRHACAVIEERIQCVCGECQRNHRLFCSFTATVRHRYPRSIARASAVGNETIQ